MLKNLDPLLSGVLLTVLDEMEPGQWLTLTSGGLVLPEGAEDRPVFDLSSVSTEATATAILSVLPLDRSGAPIVYLDKAEYAVELPDVVFAVCGIAADAERRRIPMSRLDENDFGTLAAHAALTVHSAGEGEAAAFLLRKGRSAIT